MSNFDQFRNREQQDQLAKNQIATKFVAEGESSTIITTESNVAPTEAAKFLRIFKRADFAASTSSAPYQTVNLLNEVTSLDFMLWSPSFSPVVSYYFGDSASGIQFGSRTYSFKSVILTSSDFKHITKIEVTANGATGTNAKIFLQIGDMDVGEPFVLTTVSTTSTTLVPEAYSGKLKIIISQTTDGALYLKSVKVYTTEQPVIDIQANLVYENKETPDKVYVFTKKEYPLEIGQIFNWSDLRYIVTDIEKIVKNVFYNKYLAYECNFTINGLWGWFSGLRDKYIGTTLKDGRVVVSDAKPIAVLPGNPYSVGDTIVINDRPWLVIEYDNISCPGVTYYSLEATRLAKVSDPSTIIPATPDPTLIEVKPLQKITLTTENGYFVSSIELTVSRTPTSAIFEVPFGVGEFTVDVKVDGMVQNKKYKVVL